MLSVAIIQATNRLSEAEPLMRRALTIDEASFGPDHPRSRTSWGERLASALRRSVPPSKGSDAR
jgi:hypothetical protein